MYVNLASDSAYF